MTFTAHLQTHPHRPGGCWTCLHWDGDTTPGDVHAVCMKDGNPIVLGHPATGCCYWTPDSRKEIGEDQFPGM